MNRWTVAAGWTVVMAIVWAFAVPIATSATTFVMLWMAGLIVSFVAAALLHDSQTPQSVNAILSELETEARVANRSGRSH